MNEAPIEPNALHVLIVDDDKRICDLVCRYLSENGFLVSAAPDAKTARELLSRFVFDALMIDIMMPGESGLSFTKSLRDSDVWKDIPVLLLTALGEAEDRIKGLEQGADDYLSKPFEPRELVLRLQSILKRSQTVQKDQKSFKIGKWTYNPETSTITHDDIVIKLTRGEDNLVKALASGEGEVVSRHDVAELCGVDAGERTIDVQVTRLRRKLEEDTKNPLYLQTVRGKGYLLRVEKI